MLQARQEVTAQENYRKERDLTHELPKWAEGVTSQARAPNV